MCYTTVDALEEWDDLLRSVGREWGQQISECWKDLPPDVYDAVIKASAAIGDAKKAVLEHLAQLEAA